MNRDYRYYEKQRRRKVNKANNFLIIWFFLYTIALLGLGAFGIYEIEAEKQALQAQKAKNERMAEKAVFVDIQAEEIADRYADEFYEKYLNYRDEIDEQKREAVGNVEINMEDLELAEDNTLSAEEAQEELKQALTKLVMKEYAEAYGVLYQKAGLPDEFELINYDEDYAAYRDTRNYEYGKVECNWDWIDNYIYIDEGCTEDDVTYFKYALSLVPDEALYRIVDDGWTFHLVDEIVEGQIANENANYHTEGMTRFDSKVVEVDKDSNIRRTTLHEIGHVIMRQYGGLKLADERGIKYYDYPELYNTYNPSTNGGLYIYWNLDEHLADRFFEYCCYPKELERDCPIVYSVYTDTLTAME